MIYYVKKREIFLTIIIDRFKVVIIQKVA